MSVCSNMRLLFVRSGISLSNCDHLEHNHFQKDKVTFWLYIHSDFIKVLILKCNRAL